MVFVCRVREWSARHAVLLTQLLLAEAQKQRTSSVPLTLRVPRQSGASSSPSPSPLLRSDPEPVVDISHSVFYSRLKTFLS